MGMADDTFGVYEKGVDAIFYRKPAKKGTEQCEMGGRRKRC